MPTGYTYGRQLHPQGFRHMSRFGPPESELARFLYPLAKRDVVYYFDDFIGGNDFENVNTDWNETILLSKVGNGGTVFVPAGTQLVNGIALGVTGGATGDSTAMYTALEWSGDNRCGMEIRLQVSNIDNSNWEVGFNNSITSPELVVIDDIDTPSWDDGEDIAFIGRQTEATLKTMALVTDGVTGSMDATKTNLGTRNMTNSTYMTMRVQLDGNQTFAYVFDENQALIEHAAHGATIASQIEGGTLLQSRLVWEDGADSTINISIDYWGIWQDRVV